MKSSEIELLVVGNDKNSKGYKAKVRHLGLEKRVHFFGAVSNIYPFYQVADTLVIPSFYDPFANVTVEALAMGLFVVSSRTNGGSEILDANNGTIIDDLFSTDAIIHALEKALQHRKTATSAYAIRQSVSHLDFSQQLKSLVQLCE